MKALVLGGGGAKGSYEVGVWKALNKLNMKFDIVTGVSIGSINGAFYVANEYKKCLKMWRTITTNDLFDVAIGSKLSKEDLQSLVKQMSTGGISFANAEKFLKKNINEEKVRKSKINYGLVTVSLTNKKPRFLTKEQIPYGKLVDYICASSICYPFVHTQDINDESFIDVVINNYNGYIFKNKSELTQLILKLIENKRLLENLENNAKISSNDYSLSCFASKVKDVYKKALKEYTIKNGKNTSN